LLGNPIEDIPRLPGNLVPVVCQISQLAAKYPYPPKVW
jgi:hypothetical protein